MLAEIMSRQMIERGLKGTRFFKMEPVLDRDLNGAGWYVHMPFCRRLCPYCCFRSLRYAPHKVDPYIKAVKKEISRYRDMLGKIETGDIYFGGGTPSLTWEGIIEVIQHLRENFEVRGNIGVEASPEDIDDSICAELSRSGVNRISMGVQSFDSGILATMKRSYDTGTVFKSIDSLLGKGFYVNIDMLYGLPGQTISNLTGDLEQAVKTGASQISIYPLMLFTYTKWYREVERGNIKVPPSKLEKEMYYTICGFLTSHEYRQASCWDFVRAASGEVPYETCTRDENIGVGLSAYSKIGGAFYVNTFYLRQYIEAVESRLPVAIGMTMPLKRVMRRWFMMELFRIKVKKTDFEKRFGVPLEEAMGSFVRMLKMINIVKEHPDYLEVTRQGMYWISLLTKRSMLTFPAAYTEKCLHEPWPGEFTI